MRTRRKRKRAGRWVPWAVLAVLALIAGVFAYVLWQVMDTADSVYQPIDRLPSSVRPAEEASPVQQQPEREKAKARAQTKTFLFLGLDRREQSADLGRTDVILLAVVNGGQGKITLLSLPRDTYVEIAGKGYKDKVNHAYQYGVATTIATVESFAGVRVDHYVEFDFAGFKKAVDAVGGLELDVDAEFAGKFGIAPGLQRLDGGEALDFARFRSDARGDFGRNDRQQMVFRAYLDQTGGVRSPGKIKELLGIMGEGVRTDISLAQLTAFALHLPPLQAGAVESLRYEAATAFGPQNLSYVVVSEEERVRVMKELQSRAE